MTKVLLRTLATALFFTFGLTSLYAQGTPGTAFGTVHYSNGGTPGAGEITFVAYLTKAPSQTVTQSSPGCGYNAGSATWFVELSNFGSPGWVPGDEMVIELTGCCGPGGVETGTDQGSLSASANFGDTSLPVALSTFAAEPGDGTVTIKWATESEVDNLGFYIYRSLAADGEYIKINSKLIEGQVNSTNTAEYEYVDLNVDNGVTYFYKLEDVNLNGTTSMHGPIEVTVGSLIPEEFALRQNYPNPFNPSTNIEIDLPENSHLKLRIFNLLGQEVATLVDEERTASTVKVQWDGRDQFGNIAPAGVYIYQAIAGEYAETRKMLFVK